MSSASQFYPPTRLRNFFCNVINNRFFEKMMRWPMKGPNAFGIISVNSSINSNLNPNTLSRTLKGSSLNYVDKMCLYFFLLLSLFFLFWLTLIETLNFKPYFVGSVVSKFLFILTNCLLNIFFSFFNIPFFFNFNERHPLKSFLS